MEPQILLYIGGCADGQRRMTAHSQVIIPKFDDNFRITQQFTINNIDSVEHLYRRERICGPSVVLTVMLWDKLTPNDMIEALVTKYPAPLNDD